MHRFDAISRLLATRTSRRSTVLGAGAAVASGTAFSSAHAAPQDATPEASPVPTDTEKVPFLFVQSASSATFAENTDANYTAEYLLTLKGHTGGTVFFSDRPERIFGEAPTQQFLDGLGFDPANPPNAAIVTTNTDGSGDVLLVELTQPTYSAGTGELSYGASILQGYTGEGLAFAASQQQDPILAPELGSTSLFIDDCPDLTTCMRPIGLDMPPEEIGSLPGEPYGQCWHWKDFSCEPCDGNSSDYFDDLCNQTYTTCNGECFAS